MSVVAAISLASSAAADNMGCGLAANDYSSALELVRSFLKDYSACVAANRGRDDCGREFRRLQVAQSRFEPLVLKVQADCRSRPLPNDRQDREAGLTQPR